jgi:hypothetical protein
MATPAFTATTGVATVLREVDRLTCRPWATPSPRPWASSSWANRSPFWSSVRASPESRRPLKKYGSRARVLRIGVNRPLAMASS